MACTVRKLYQFYMNKILYRFINTLGPFSRALSHIMDGEAHLADERAYKKLESFSYT